MDIRTTTKYFFNRAGVIDAISKGNRQALIEIGAIVRQVMKRSIRKRKAPAQPGGPPHSHAGHLRKHIYFHYSHPSQSVIIGPALLSGVRKNIAGPQAPELLEFGGTIKRKKSMKRGGRMERTYRYPAFPFAGPALQKSITKGLITKQFENIIGKTVVRGI